MLANRFTTTLTSNDVIVAVHLQHIMVSKEVRTGYRTEMLVQGLTSLCLHVPVHAVYVFHN